MKKQEIRKTTGPIPAAIESMIEGLIDPQKNKFLKETHLDMIKRSIDALQSAVNEYEKGSWR